MKKYNLYLASNSPRRKELLQWSYIPFKVEVSGIDEISQFSNPHEYVMDFLPTKSSRCISKIKIG